MKISRVCLLISGIAIAGIGVGGQSVAQPLPSGEIQMPSDLATFVVQSEADQNNPEGFIGTLNIDGLQGVLLEWEAASESPRFSWRPFGLS